MLGIFWGVAVLFFISWLYIRKLSMVWMLATITICVASILANKKSNIWMFLNIKENQKMDTRP